MLYVTTSILIEAPPDQTSALFLDVSGWPRLFPATIRAARIARESPGGTVIEVSHAEGQVVNLLRVKSRGWIELEEFHPRFDALFIHSFLREAGGTRYVVAGKIALKGALRWLEPVAARVVRARMQRLILQPVKRAAEALPVPPEEPRAIPEQQRPEA